ncbi:DUF2530 domain-containing protein [Pengzhenrongella frigida]|uniref:DUF2530 domain-containing protein n=1 Tax=Pengzhenrongella frigida TaxID=1259133 RepID=A0A4Q5MWQ1_9MICO|nr:DUF2530 domain-containing protein [Cellulomonas sp. HLT2-17]RYV50038.1 DUF2530 domain-containing protein [Cellulomonas sp. HLT2-17]
MPSVFALIMNPDQRRPDPAPLPIDLVKLILVGLAAWVVALAVTWIQYRAGSGLLQSVWTCVAGVTGGLLALIWAKVTRPQLG